MRRITIAAMVFLATSTGCQVDVSSSINTNSKNLNRTTTMANGHTLAIVSDVSTSNSLVNDTETWRLGNHQLVVEFAKQQVLFDGKELLALPPETKRLDVEYLEGNLVLKADGNLLTLPKISN
jgi:archaellum component FlaF (FlaF/FlaG flagellin family)